MAALVGGLAAWEQAGYLTTDQEVASNPSSETVVDAPGSSEETKTVTFAASDEAMILGDPDAPVTIIEFSDYQCPFCLRHFQQTWPKIKAEYVDTGKVRYVFKDFPLTSIHPQAPKAHEAARCAGEQEAYWEMHDRLFAGQSEWGNKANHVEVYKDYAAELGLDQAAFDTCLDSGRWTEAVDTDTNEGIGLSVRGTPTFFINGQALVGAQPYEVFVQAFESVLAGGSPAAANPAPPTPVPSGPAPNPGPATITPADEAMILGDPDAPVTIVEFSDYQCPFCQRHFQQTWPQIKAEFVDTGRVRYVFKDFPLTSIHPQAPKAHEAARCAGEQDAYWEMHDRLFAGQSQWGNKANHEEVYKGYAAELDLDQTAFDTCLDSGRWADAVQADFAEGASLSVRGTPTFFINGQALVGAQPYEVFQQAIESIEGNE